VKSSLSIILAEDHVGDVGNPPVPILMVGTIRGADDNLIVECELRVDAVQHAAPACHATRACPPSLGVRVDVRRGHLPVPAALQ